jgi:hypothetical protein
MQLIQPHLYATTGFIEAFFPRKQKRKSAPFCEVLDIVLPTSLSIISFQVSI